MLIKDQDEVIAMLEGVRDQKLYVVLLPCVRRNIGIESRKQLARLSDHALSTPGAPVDQQVKMEVDSTASSPHD